MANPSPLMIDYMEKKFGLDRSRICMVGDRLDTDILFGNDNGLKSCLTLSGVTTEEQPAGEQGDPRLLRRHSSTDYRRACMGANLQSPARGLVARLDVPGANWGFGTR